MGYTSTNSLGRTHFGGDLVAGGSKPSRNGIALNVVSTGNTPSISAVGDDSTVGITITPKGDASVTIGSTTGSVTIGSSGSAIRHILSGASTFLYPALAANASGDSTVTAPGVSTGSRVTVNLPSSMSTVYDFGGAWASGANEITVRFRNATASTQGTGFSTSDVLRWSAITF